MKRPPALIVVGFAFAFMTGCANKLDGVATETELVPEAQATTTTRSHRVVFDPRNSKADEHGLVAAPNVNLEEDLVGARQDRAMYLANLAVIQTEDEMTGALLDDVA